MYKINYLMDMIIQLYDTYKEEIKETKINNYSILNYYKKNINSSNIEKLGIFRSVVKKNNKIMCMSPNKMLEYNSYIKRYTKYKIEEYIEGIMINCFFDKKWNFATYDTINNENIINIFNNSFDKENWDIMNKTNTYSFLIQDISFKLINNKETKIYLIDVFDSNYCSIIEEIRKNNNIKNILFSKKIDLSLNDAIKKYCSINSNILIKGIVLRNKNKCTKVRNSAYEYYKYIFTTKTLKSIYDYCYYLKNKEIKKFIAIYDIETLKIIKRNFFNITYNIYLTYRNIYIRKSDNIDNYTNIKKRILKNIHYKYINILRPKREFVTKKYVIEYINMLSINDIFILLSDIGNFYKRLNKLGI